MVNYNSETEQFSKKQNILEVLNNNAEVFPNRIAFQFLNYYRDERTKEEITFPELNKKAKRIAAYLQKEGMEGKRAVLLYPDGIDFIIAILGCLYAKVIAVPLYHFRTKRKAERLVSIINDSAPSIFLTNSDNLKKLENFSEGIFKEVLQWVATDQLTVNDDANGYEFQWMDYKSNDLAYLQYTSGSTSDPKGVMITHENIMHNLDVIHWHFETNDESIGVSWIPHYHDMGLVYAIFHPIYIGFMQVLMHPSDFIGKPYRFFKAISDFRGSIFSMPNFAFDYCVKVMTDEQKKDLDLSCIQRILNGSEPVYHQSMNNFYDYFRSCGLKKNAIMPAYGLAEATLVVSASEYKTEDSSITSIHINGEQLEKGIIELTEKSKSSVNCCSSGRIRDDITVKIVDPNTLEECGEQRTGEIWVSSKSVSPGYWKKSHLNEEIFKAHMIDNQEVAFLRTGDIGFIYQGNLYISGRLKDILIINGSNYYPNDIEYSVISLSSLIYDNSCVAFTLNENNSEQLYIAAEFSRDTDESFQPREIFNLIRKSISEMYSLHVNGILLLRRGSIPKTSSGKVQRSLLKKRYLENELKINYSDIQ